MLSVVEAGPDVFVGNGVETTRPRVFGGQVLGQALAAAGQTVEQDRPPHSLHSYFLRAGRASEPIRYTVTNLRDGRTFSTRAVSACQGDRVIFQMTASFSASGDGITHQQPASITSSPAAARPVADELDDMPDLYREWGSLDLRRVVPDSIHSTEIARASSAHAQVWMRTVNPIPADPLLHSSILACISDLSFLSVALLPHGISMRHEHHQVASINHAVWFHRPAKVDEWLLFDQTSPAAVNGLALVQGHIYNSLGSLVVSAAQQGLIRPAR
ncbi:acyl-CoA thioesterase [Rhodococcoides fascians]|uniref:acyl-CoA thioesterase n=1 Tax=Rhodococcoides fascians TaxID=1828 RepID=UPI00050C2F20|nr:acyl-CoA thioesterase domain-containing protein [Rhodococcus fascians]